MRWLTFALIGIVTVTLHTTLGPSLAVGSIRPDWILVAVVFFAMHVRSPDAVAAGWMLGLLADLQSAERFGLLSLVYGLTAGGVYLAREALFRAHPLSHAAMTFAAGCFVQGALWMYYVAVLGFGRASWSSPAATGLLVALYSALWAPIIHAGLLKFSPWLGLTSPRYSHAGLARLLR